MGESVEGHDILELVTEADGQTLLGLALAGVAGDVELPSTSAGVVVIARAVRGDDERCLLLYERRTAAPTARRSRVRRARHFVGRQSELASFDAFLISDEPSILYVHGPHGIGKTALLDAFAARCAGLGCPHVALNARLTPMTERAILDALTAPMGASETELARLRAGWRLFARRWVLCIDDFDAWASVATSAFQDVFESLPVGVRIVLAGRRPPERRWWGGCARDTALISLSALDTESSESLLALQGCRPEAREQALALAKGHPLCLVTLSSSASTPRDLAAAADGLVDTALDVRLPAAILEIAAVPSRVTEDVLGELLDDEEDIHAAYDLLTTICPRDPSGIGVRMPWFLRTTMARKLRGRSPMRFAMIRGRLAEHYAQRLAECTSVPVPGLVEDLLDFFADVSWLEALVGDSLRPPLVRLARAHETERVKAAASRLGGERAASVVERRMRLGPRFGRTHISVSEGKADGVIQLGVCTLDEAAEAARADAGGPFSAAVGAVRGLAGMTGRDPVAICATFLGGDAEADGRPGRTSNALALAVVREVLAAMPQVTAFACVVPPEITKKFLAFPGAFATRKGEYDVIVVSLRRVSQASVLLSLLEATEVRTPSPALPGGPDSRRAQASTPITLETVRSALLQLSAPGGPASSPLLFSDMVESAMSVDGGADRSQVLARLLRDAIDSLVGSPRGAKAREVLFAVFVRGGGKHEQIAREMGLPYGTFRRHLTYGVTRATEWLRQRDRDTSPPSSGARPPRPM